MNELGGDKSGSAPGRLTRSLPVTLPFVLLVVAWWPSRGAPFGIVDDHQIIALLDGRRRLPVGRILPELYDHRTETIGRFRPMYWVGQVLEAATAGDQPLWWYLDRLILAAFTLAALLYVCRQFAGPWTAAVLAPTALLGPQFEAWARLGAAEAYAMPLLALGVAALVAGARRDAAVLMVCGLAGVVASGLAKESFVPMALGATTFVAFRLRTSRRRGSTWCCVGALALVVVADCALLVHQVGRYGSQYGEDRSAAGALSWATYAVENAVAFQALAAALVVLAVGARRLRRDDLTALTVLGGAVVVEIAFYAGADHAGRYLLPATACTVGVWLVALRASSEDAPRWTHLVRTVAGCTLVLALALGSALAFRTAQGNAEATRRFQARLHALEAMIRSRHVQTVVLEPDDPYIDAELVLSLARYLHADLGVTVMTTPSRRVADPRYRSVADALATVSAHGTPDRVIAPLSPAPDCLSLTFATGPAVCPTSRPAPR